MDLQALVLLQHMAGMTTGIAGGDTGKGPAAPPQQDPAGGYVPPAHKLTTLGWLKHLKDPTWPWWEHYYLKFLHKNLTTNWASLMFGVDLEAMQLWWEVFQVLELDKKSQLDLLILAQSGPVGRSYANKLLWDVMSNWALDGTYRDLSNKVSNEVNWARKNMDRPPRGHKDLSVVEMVLLSRPCESTKALESLHSASQSMGPVHGSWWITSSSTSVLGDTPSVRGPRGPEGLEYLESLQDPYADRGVLRPGDVNEKKRNPMMMRMRTGGGRVQVTLKK